MQSTTAITATDSLTGTFILEGLKDPRNATIWNHYIERYRPILVGYAIRLGITGSDAEDVAQQILVEFCTAYRNGKYERERGRLRDWLFGIARNQAHNWQRRHIHREKQAPEPSGDQTGFLAGQADSDDLSKAWEAEWQAAVLRRCMDQIRAEVQASTFEAFELFALQDWPAEKVAEKLGLSANAVFGAKRRILRRMRELIPAWEQSF